MKCPKCQASIDDDTVFCGNCGQQIAPFQARGATMSYPNDEKTIGLGVHTQMSQLPRATPMAPAPPVYGRNETPLPPPLSAPQATQQRGRAGLLVLAVLLLVLLAGGTVLTVGLLRNHQTSQGLASNASGQVTFFDGTNGSEGTDSLRIRVNGLGIAPAGSHYDAWLVDEVGEHTTFLGALGAQGETLALNFAGNGGNGKPGTNLLSSGNRVEITEEQGNVQLPGGQIVLAASFPPKAFVHIKHLLFSFPTTPGKIGLLVGLLDQTKLLNAQALALQSIASSQKSAAIKCIAQSIVDISEGPQGQHYQPLPTACGASIPTGDGFGILGTNGYAATAATHASLAATQTDTTATIRQHAGEVETGTTTITGWVTSIDRDALILLGNPLNQASPPDIVALADHAYHGVDRNGNGQVEPIAGEEGAATAYLRGQLMAMLTLLPSVK
jgi:hypothetical protein